MQSISPIDVQDRFEQLALVEYPPYEITQESGLGEFKEFQARIINILTPDSEDLAA